MKSVNDVHVDVRQMMRLGVHDIDSFCDNPLSYIVATNTISSTHYEDLILYYIYITTRGKSHNGA